MLPIELLALVLAAAALKPAALLLLCSGAIVAVLYSRLRRVSCVQTAAPVLGFGAVVLPLLDPRAILAWGFFCLILRQQTFKTLSWAAPLLLLGLIWSTAGVAASVSTADWQLLRSNPGQFLTWYSTAPAPELQNLELMLRWFLLAALLPVLASDRELLRQVLRGALLAVPIALIALVLQLNGSAHFVTQSSFWAALGRPAASFSDPNALGIGAFLLLLLTLTSEARTIAGRRGSFGLVVCCLALGLYSGSRSFIFGIIAYALIRLWGNRPKQFVGGLAILVAILLGLNGLNRATPEVLQGLRANAPSAIVRVADTLNYSTSQEALFSRWAFLRIAAEIWHAHPILGVGPAAFAGLVPVTASKLGLSTGLWADNPNNFYLGILAEFGLLGFFALFLCMRRLGFSPGAEPAMRAGVGAFMLLLLLGPHLDFNEITVLFAVLSGFALTPRPERAQLTGAPFLLLCSAAAIATAAWSGPRGLYNWEPDGNSGVARWTISRARTFVDCGANNSATLHYQLLNPDLERRPVVVQLSVPGEPALQQLHRRAGSFDQSWRCISDQAGLPAAIPIDISVSRMWIPAAYKLSSDPRALGIRLLFDKLPQQ
ncbi:MAG: O-antigen ligase family protein [Oligoflexia bacterium]|nr:O-antigen ligase family protein [Oligoflexia bacterium]